MKLLIALALILFCVNASALAQNVTIDKNKISGIDTINLSYSNLYDGTNAQLIITSQMYANRTFHFYLKDIWTGFAITPAKEVVKVGPGLDFIMVSLKDSNNEYQFIKSLHGNDYIIKQDMAVPVQYFQHFGIEGTMVENQTAVNTKIKVTGIKSGFKGSEQGTIPLKIDTDMKGRFNVWVKYNGITQMKKWVTVS